MTSSDTGNESYYKILLQCQCQRLCQITTLSEKASILNTMTFSKFMYFDIKNPLAVSSTYRHKTLILHSVIRILPSFNRKFT